MLYWSCPHVFIMYGLSNKEYAVITIFLAFLYFILFFKYSFSFYNTFSFTYKSWSYTYKKLFKLIQFCINSNFLFHSFNHLWFFVNWTKPKSKLDFSSKGSCLRTSVQLFMMMENINIPLLKFVLRRIGHLQLIGIYLYKQYKNKQL